MRISTRGWYMLCDGLNALFAVTRFCDLLDGHATTDSRPFWDAWRESRVGSAYIQLGHLYLVMNAAPSKRRLRLLRSRRQRVVHAERRRQAKRQSVATFTHDVRPILNR